MRKQHMKFHISKDAFANWKEKKSSLCLLRAGQEMRRWKGYKLQLSFSTSLPEFKDTGNLEHIT